MLLRSHNPKTRALLETLTGEGILNKNLRVSAIGNTTEILRNNDTVYIIGNAKYFTESNMDVATYKFQAIGYYGPDGYLQK